MQNSTIATYGGPYVDASAVNNPTSQLAAAKGNRAFEDLAQLTRVGYRAIVRFTTTATAAPVTYAAANVSAETAWGNSDAYKPTVAKTATGIYTVTFAASYTDGLSESETVALIYGHASVDADAPAPRITMTSGVVATVKVLSTGFAANDLGGTAPVTVWLR